jgi:hypothetical protein
MPPVSGHFRVQGYEGVPVPPVLNGRYREASKADADHDQRKLAWSDDSVNRLGPLKLELEEFIDRETESNERGRRSDPGHHGPIMG